MSKVHEVKTSPEHFWPQVAGFKTFDVRYNDRGYKVGDILRQKEWSPYGGYTGSVLDREITYVLDDPEYCKEGFVVLGLKTLSRGGDGARERRAMIWQLERSTARRWKRWRPSWAG